MCICNYKEYFNKNKFLTVYTAGADPGGGGGGRTRRDPPAKIEKNMIYWRKIVIFHTIEKYPKKFRASLRSAQFF